MYSILCAILFAYHFFSVLSQEIPRSALMNFCRQFNMTECVAENYLGPDRENPPLESIPEEYRGRYLQPRNNTNQWKIEVLQIHRPKVSGKLDTSFVLYRSIWTPCVPGRFPEQEAERSTCFWRISRDPVYCKVESFDIDVWQSCQFHLNRVDGERQVSAETKHRLKWRISEDNKSSNDTTGPLKLGKFEIVFSVPLDESRDRWKYSWETGKEKVVVYSVAIDLPSKAVNCKTDIGTSWSCLLNGPQWRPYLGPGTGVLLYNVQNVSEEIIPAGDFPKRYW